MVLVSSPGIGSEQSIKDIIRVLVVFSTSELGGAERSITRMAAASQSGGGIDYELATLDGMGPWLEWAATLGLAPVFFGRRRSTARHGQFGLRAIWTLVRHARRQKPDAIYVIGLRASVVLRVLKPFLASKLVLGVRWNPASTSRLDVAFRFVEKRLGQMIDLYLVNSKAAAETIQESCGVPLGRIRIAYNGIEEIKGILEPISCRPPNVLTIANLNPRKGYLEYIQIIRRLANELPGVRFSFVGRDDMNGQVQRAIQEAGLESRVSYLGFVTDVSPLLREARLFVLPSLWNEGCPTSVIEAMAHGVPVVAYSLDGLPELVRDGKEGCLVPLGDKDALARAIVSLVRDPRQAERLGQRARERVEAKFTLRHCAETHLAAFRHVLLEQ